MTDSSELQGEIAALRCFVAALATTLPLSSQLRLWPAFECQASLIRDALDQESLRGFERALGSLAERPAHRSQAAPFRTL